MAIMVSGGSFMPRIAFTGRGRVQGVGFRAAAAHEAERLHLSGFVRNHPIMADRVDGEAEGAQASLDGFQQWLRRGPRLARVTAVSVSDLPEQEDHAFIIR